MRITEHYRLCNILFFFFFFSSSLLLSGRTETRGRGTINCPEVQLVLIIGNVNKPGLYPQFLFSHYCCVSLTYCYHCVLLQTGIVLLCDEAAECRTAFGRLVTSVDSACSVNCEQSVHIDLCRCWNSAGFSSDSSVALFEHNGGVTPCMCKSGQILKFPPIRP